MNESNGNGLGRDVLLRVEWVKSLVLLAADPSRGDEARQRQLFMGVSINATQLGSRFMTASVASGIRTTKAWT